LIILPNLKFLIKHPSYFLALGFGAGLPFPINYLDKHVGGGLGIMLDDYVAAFFALIIYFSIQWLIL